MVDLLTEEARRRADLLFLDDKEWVRIDCASRTHSEILFARLMKDAFHALDPKELACIPSVPPS
jgi:hypothetical protein